MSPVEGFPDPSVHRICRYCGKWFCPDEGRLVNPEGRFERNYLLSTGSLVRFQCDQCTRARRRRRWILWGGLAALAIAALFIRWLLDIR